MTRDEDSYSDRSVCMTSTRDARAAGSSDARIAAVTRTMAAPAIGSAQRRGASRTENRAFRQQRASQRAPVCTKRDTQGKFRFAADRSAENDAMRCSGHGT